MRKKSLWRTRLLGEDWKNELQYIKDKEREIDDYENRKWLREVILTKSE